MKRVKRLLLGGPGDGTVLSVKSKGPFKFRTGTGALVEYFPRTVFLPPNYTKLDIGELQGQISSIQDILRFIEKNGIILATKNEKLDE